MKKILFDNLHKTFTPMVEMALNTGISYQELDLLIKQIFIKESRKITKKLGKKVTDASVSAMTGISRTAIAQMKTTSKVVQKKTWIGFPNRVISTWIGQDLSESIPYSDSNAPNFVDLVQGITTEKSARTILNEMLRLNLVKIKNDQISIVPLSEYHLQNEAKEILMVEFSNNLQAHSQAGVNNLITKSNTSFLEQAVQVDGIHLYSAKKLSEISVKVWKQAAKTFINEAQPISDEEEKEGGKHKLTFGVYCYYE